MEKSSVLFYEMIGEQIKKKREIKMANVYQMVTDRIIAELEEGNIPWQKPWTGVRTGAFNRVTKKPYSLLNQLLLEKPGEWATFKQWSDLGGKVKKGEKSRFVVFWKMLRVEETKDDGEVTTKIIPLLKYINVFHISQVDDVEPLKKEELSEIEPIEEAEKIKTNYQEREHIKIIESVSNEAYYSPISDYIQIPVKGQYQESSEYYSTLFHEMVHSTGHKTRLNRLEGKMLAAFGSEDYSKGELVAELGNSFILNSIGIETPKSFRNNAAYIQSWLKVLRSDVKFIVSAASKAEKAVQYIMEGNGNENDIGIETA